MAHICIKLRRTLYIYMSKETIHNSLYLVFDYDWHMHKSSGTTVRTMVIQVPDEQGS